MSHYEMTERVDPLHCLFVSHRIASSFEFERSCATRTVCVLLILINDSRLEYLGKTKCFQNRFGLLDCSRLHIVQTDLWSSFYPARWMAKILTHHDAEMWSASVEKENVSLDSWWRWPKMCNCIVCTRTVFTWDFNQCVRFQLISCACT